MNATHPRFSQHQQRLNSQGIPTEKAGFFDHPAFVAIERKTPDFLEEYARFVHWKPHDDAYLQRAEQIIRIVAVELHRGLLLEGRLGGCIDTSMTMGRILDLYGVWNYVVRGGFRITFPAESGYAPINFVPLEIDDGSGKEFGHKWLFAPPFQVIDVTLKLQDYQKPVHSYLPDHVLAESPLPYAAKPSDILCREAIQDIVMQGGTEELALKRYFPKYDCFGKDFPSCLVKHESGLELRYIPIGVGGSDCSLKHIRSYMVQGRSAHQFYEQDIKPKLAAAGFEETLDESEFPGGMTAGTPMVPGRVGDSLPGRSKLTPRERAEERKKKRKNDKRKRK